MSQTIKQYIASVKRVNGCPDDLDYQVNAWPYPQSNQSHIAIFRQSWTTKRDVLPKRQIRVRVDYSNMAGVLMEIREGEITPRQVVKQLKN